MKNNMLAKKNLIIPNNHLLLTTTNEVKQICQPLFKSTPFNYFDLTRLDNNGFINELSSNAERSKFIYEKNNSAYYMAPTIPKRLLNNLSYYIFCYEEQKSNFLVEFGKMFQIVNVFIIFEKHSTYTDCYCFGTEAKNIQVINFFLNNIKNLTKFGFVFKEKTANLIKKFSKNKIIPPKICQQINREVNNNTRFNIKLLHSEAASKFATLTNKEKEYFEYFSKGYTIKEIAKIFCLSPRTIETHLANIKLKFQVTKKSDLIKLAIH